MKFSFFDADAVSLGDAGLDWVPVRRELGVEAFGVNGYRANSGEPVIEEHAESPGQEELYVVLRGRARFTLAGDECTLDTGEAVFVDDPEAVRSAVAIEDDTVMMAIGGWREQAYHSLPWEPIYLSGTAFRAGDWAGAMEVLERESREHRTNPFVRYRIACCLAQLGETGEALDELANAIEARPAIRERALADDLLAPLHARLRSWPPLER